MAVVSKSMPLHMAITVHLPLTAGVKVCKWFHIITLASTTALDSTQINIGVWNVKQLSNATLIMDEYYQMKTENQSKSTLQ